MGEAQVPRFERQPKANSDRSDPGRYPRRALLAVVGTTPQVLTETVYAMATAASVAERFVPTEVHVITTAAGAQLIRDRLFAAPGGAWSQLLADHRLGPIAFDPSHVVVVAGPDGHPLADIRSAADNACVADAISERVRGLTADTDCALHVSLAGGRKTMGYYAGYALSLFGRAQDRLSHVLVASEYEAAPDFYYPTPVPRMLPTRGSQSRVDASCATIELAQIPFVRLRALMPRALLFAPSTFAAVVAAARMPPSAPQLRLDVERSLALLDGRSVHLTPTLFALFAALAQRAKEGKPVLPAPPRDAHDPAWATEVLQDLRRAVGLMYVDSKVASSLTRDCAGNKISPHLSRLRRLLREQLDPGRDRLYFEDGGSQRHKRYRVPLPPDAIEIVRAEPGCKLARKRSTPNPEDTAPGQTSHRAPHRTT